MEPFKVSGCGFEIPNLMRNQLSESAKTSQAKMMNYSTVFASEDNEMNFQPKKNSLIRAEEQVRRQDREALWASGIEGGYKDTGDIGVQCWVTMLALSS